MLSISPSPSNFLIPVNPDSLICEDVQATSSSEDDSEDDTAVCGTNGVTYPNLCRLLQDTDDEAVAYAGRCGRKDCQGGPVSINGP